MSPYSLNNKTVHTCDNNDRSEHNTEVQVIIWGFLKGQRLQPLNKLNISKRQSGGNVIFSAPIKDRRLKLFDNIPISKEHNQL